MDKYKIKVTRQAKEHLALIREYIATELKEPTIAKRILKKCTQYPCGALFFGLTSIVFLPYTNH